MPVNIKLTKKIITKKRIVFEFSGGDLSKRKHVFKVDDISKTAKIFYNYFNKLKDNALDLSELNLEIKYIVPNKKRGKKNLHTLDLIKYSKQTLYLSNEYFSTEEIKNMSLIANKISKVKKIIFFKSILKNGWLHKVKNQFEKISSLFGHYGWFDTELQVEKLNKKYFKPLKGNDKTTRLLEILRKSLRKKNLRKKFGSDYYTIKEISKKLNKEIVFYSLGSSKKSNQILKKLQN